MWKEAERAKFVYDPHTGDFRGTYDWKAHHGDLLEEMGIDEDRAIQAIYEKKPLYVFGEDYPQDEAPVIHHRELYSPEVVDQALEAYYNWTQNADPNEPFEYSWVEKNATATGLLGGNRVAWLINYKHQIKMGVPGQHHVDLGWAGDEIAQGDIFVEEDPYKGTPEPGQILLRVLTLDYNYDWDEVVNQVEQEWDRLHPDLQITKFENLAAHPETWYEDPEDQWEGLTNHASYDIIGGMKISFSDYSLSDPEAITDPNGLPWKLYQMESGEYENHHALVVDNNHHRMFLNYHGHHGPLMEAAMQNGIPGETFYNSVQGHYRLEPSNDEPFVEGWGFHHGSLHPWQEQVLGSALKQYHNVDDLEKAWVNFKEATVQWLGNVVSKTWKALYDRKEAILYFYPYVDELNASWLNQTIGKEVFFKNGNIKKSGGFTQAEGIYTTISYILPTGAKDIEAEKEKVRGILEVALQKKWPTVVKETHFVNKYGKIHLKEGGIV